MSSKAKKICCVLCIGLFVLSLVPMLVISFYNHPAIDDFYYGIKTYHAFQETGSFWQTIKAAVAQVAETYQNWQGSYSVVFLFALHPAIFSEGLYAINTFLFLGCFIGASLFLFYVILKVYIKVSNVVYCLIALPITWFSIQLVPAPVQCFYWWNGSVYYCLFYSLFLFFCGILLLYYRCASKKKQVGYFLAAVLLAVILAGGNYVTALLCAILLFCAAIFLWKQRSAKAKYITLLFIIFLAGFLVNMLSPGNAVRAACYDDTPSVIGTIIESIYYGWHFLLEWFTLPIVFLTIVIGILCFSIVKKMTFSFRYPLIFLLFSFGLFCAQFAPPVYGMGSYGEGRILDVIYFSFYWLLFSNIFYFCGWLQKRFFQQSTSDFHKGKIQIASLCFVAALLLPLGQNSDREEMWHSYSSTSALYSLWTGEAQTYDSEYQARLQILTDPTIQWVEFKPFSVTPRLLYYGDLTQDPNYEWSNLPMRKYYDKEHVVVIWS